MAGKMADLKFVSAVVQVCVGKCIDWINGDMDAATDWLYKGLRKQKKVFSYHWRYGSRCPQQMQRLVHWVPSTVSSFVGKTTEFEFCAQMLNTLHHHPQTLDSSGNVVVWWRSNWKRWKHGTQHWWECKHASFMNWLETVAGIHPRCSGWM